jgi:signal transduction histidine kinase
VLLLGFAYAFAYVFLAPYPGADYNDQWEVFSFDDACNIVPDWCVANRDALRVGDRLVVIGDLAFQDYQNDRTRVPFAGYGPGDIVPITFVRDGIIQHTNWQMLGTTGPVRLYRLLNSLIFFLPFWLAGTVVLLFLRPRDTRWRLLIAFNYVTAVWLTAGIPSTTRVAGSSLALHALTWVLVPVYLHLHYLLVPTSPVPRRRRNLFFSLYILVAILAVLELLQLLPNSAYYLGLLLALAGSLVLLLSRSLGRAPSSARQAARLMLAGVSLAFGPVLGLWVIPSLLHVGIRERLLTYITTVAIPLLPFFYVYALYKHRLGGLEFRANRALSLYSFLVLYGTAFILIFIIGSQWVELTTEGLAFALVVSALFVTVALFLRTPFQRFIDRLAYGTKHNPDDIIRTFANEIPRALHRDTLARLLTQEMAPSLLIRQSALYRITDSEVALIYADGIQLDDTDVAQPVRDLLTQAGRYRPPEPAPQDRFDWVRLAIAIEVEKKPIGVWLFGQRDPDDFYPQPDIELLATLGNQVGVALETSRLFENVQHRATELESAYRQLQRLDQLKDEFVQTVSHELRTPLTLVQGYAELLLEEGLGPLTAEQREALETVADRTVGTIRLVNDVLSVQQAALEQIEYEQVNLVALARSSIQAAEVIARKQKQRQQACTFALDVPEDVPPVWGDRRRLGQVLDNLLGNAVKFSPSGGTITVQVRSRHYQFDAQRADGPQPAVEVSVSDQGIGIPAAQINRIWERFYQVDSSTTRRFGGMGLGLAIVQNIVKTHGGVIWAESAEGAGATFRFVLPTLVSADQTAG